VKGVGNKILFNIKNNITQKNLEKIDENKVMHPHDRGYKSGRKYSKLSNNIIKLDSWKAITTKEETLYLAIPRLHEYISDDEAEVLRLLQLIVKSIYSEEFDMPSFINNTNKLFDLILKIWKTNFISIKVHTLREICLFIKFIGLPSNWLGFIFG
jgi:hypothetical protein